MESVESGSERLRRLHVVSGAFLLVFVVAHLWEIAAAPAGREALVQRMSWHDGGGAAPIVILFLVLLPLLAHVVSGLALARAARPEATEGYTSHGSRKLQWLSGLILLVFIGVHLADTWWLELVEHADAGRLHDHLRRRVGLPHVLTVYLLAAGALVLHLAQGVMAVLERRRESGASPAKNQRLVGGAVVILATLAFLLLVNTIGYFAAGRGPILDPSSSSQVSGAGD